MTVFVLYFDCFYFNVFLFSFCIFVLFLVFLTLLYRPVLLLLMMRTTAWFRALAFMLYGSVPCIALFVRGFGLLTAVS